MVYHETFQTLSSWLNSEVQLHTVKITKLHFALPLYCIIPFFHNTNYVMKSTCLQDQSNWMLCELQTSLFA